MAESIADSAYYPPRARGFRRFKSVWYHFRRISHLDQLTKATIVPTDVRMVSWLLLPGTQYLYQHKLVRGTSILTIWLLAMAFYWVEIGSPASSTAFLILCGLHSLSANAALLSALPGLASGQRLWRAGASAFLIVFIGYTLFQELVVKSVVIAVDVDKQTALIAPGVSAGSIRRGEWVAYKIPSTNGLGFEQVLGVPGDIVRFHPDCIEVNGRYYARTNKNLPTAESFEVDKGCYLIWPTQTRGNHATEETLMQWRRDRCLVAQDDILGRSYERWFRYRQAYPPLIPITSPRSLTGKQP